MGWLNGFVTTALCVVFITALCNTLMPEGNLSKFVNLVLGLVVVVTIVGAVIGIGNINLDEILNLTTPSAEEAQIPKTQYTDNIAKNFSLNVASDIVARIKQNHNCDIEAEVSVTCDENGNVSGIETITLKLPLNADADVITKEISTTYGVDIKNIILQ